MTTVIDHAIAIPIRPANVWDVIRDISKNPTWHPDCQRIQFLTTMKNGRGTRWRNTTKSNKEQVMEITAWYEGLGYEYRIVDGSNYLQNRGRIRLQESPEGTVVQWTFSYDVDGFWGSIRNRFGMKSHVDKLVIQGLRNLYAALKDLKAEDLINPEDSKAYLREAPNVEERASYQPRYPSKVKSQEIPIVELKDEDAPFKPPIAEPLQSVSPIPMIDEPPLVEEDTRPNPSIQQVNEPTIQTDEPDFLKAMPAQSSRDEEITIENVVADKLDTQSNETQETTAISESSAQATVEPLIPETDISKLDTSKISVFELFGIDKPSETEKVKPLTPSSTSKPTIPNPLYEPPRSFMDSAPILPDIQPEVLERRRGLRAALRRRITKVRVPNLNK